MKRLALLVIIVWFHLAPAHAQFNGCSSFCGTSSSAVADAPGFNNNQASGGGCADANVVAWKAAVVTAGGTVSAGQLTNVCTLVGSLKAHSLFSIQDRIWLHASENTQQATIDIVNLDVATPVAAPTFTANQGYTGNGTTSYLSTTYNHGTNFLQNSASISSYIRNSRTTNNNGVSVGNFDSASTGTNTMLVPLTGGTFSYDVNDGVFLNQPANAQAQGFWTASRTGASALALYHNSNSTAFNSATTASTALAVGSNFFIGARGQNGTPSAGLFSSDQLAITTMGGGMTNTQTAQFQTDLNAYMTAIGTNVY